jgi:hypothetical protein
MKLAELLGAGLVMGATCAFVAGELSIARAQDLRGIYWLAVGVASLRAAVQMAQPERKA